MRLLGGRQPRGNRSLGHLPAHHGPEDTRNVRPRQLPVRVRGACRHLADHHLRILRGHGLARVHPHRMPGVRPAKHDGSTPKPLFPPLDPHVWTRRASVLRRSGPARFLLRICVPERHRGEQKGHLHHHRGLRDSDI